MFDVYCPECAGRRLIFTSQVTRIVNDDSGIAVHFSCWCGTPGLLRTGSRASRHEVVWSAPVLAG